MGAGALAALLALATGGCTGADQARPGRPEQSDAPVVPFNSNFWSYWTHYWTTWLPDHPVYEMIELTAYENPADPADVLVRIFLTERAGSKKQYFYLNDEAETRRSRANSYFRDIAFRRSGVAGGPQDLEVSFTDKDGVPIHWSIRFGPDARLRDHGAGLTPSIHSVGSVLLLALRTRTVDTHDDRVSFGDIDYASKRAADDLTRGTRSWFNPDYYSAVIIHGKVAFTWKDGVLTNGWGRTFTRAAGKGGWYRSQSLGPENYIAFRTDRRGGLRSYSHFSRGHSLNFAFEPAIPSVARARGGEKVRFSASFDDRKPLMTGEVRVSRPRPDLINLEWVPTGPEWAIGRDFRSTIRTTETGYELVTMETGGGARD